MAEVTWLTYNVINFIRSHFSIAGLQRQFLKQPHFNFLPDKIYLGYFSTLFFTGARVFRNA
jgi:hypothetical protein